MLLFSLNMQKEIPTAVYNTNSNWNGCVFDYREDNRKLTLCLSIPSESCRLSTLANIIDATTLQNRKDDLTFLSLNYPNCSATAPIMQGIYNSFVPPTSIGLYKHTGIITALSNSNTTISFRENCNFIPDANELLNLEELITINRIEAELGMFTNISSQCFSDLNTASEVISLVSEIKAGSKKNAFRLLSWCRRPN